MRLIELRLKNLNSLKGEWHIDFSDAAFTNEGIFAITGQTGAGKTTILDAVCLALYGETPRINSISKSSNEVMTRQTAECFAEVVIDLNGVQYRCRWGQRRAYNKSDGNLQDATHEIALIKPPAHDSDKTAGDEILESKLSRTKDKIVSLTRMDFQQFTRSILLAQGSFSAFLKAKADERADILEKITGTDIYATISTHVFEKKRAEEDILSKLQFGLEGLTLLTAEEEAAISEQLSGYQSAQSAKQRHYQDLGKQIHWLDTVAELEKNVRYYQDELTLATQAQTDFMPDAKRLMAANKALEMDSQYSQLIHNRDTVKRLQDERQKTNQQLPQQKQRLVQASSTLTAAVTRVQDATHELQTALPKIKKARELDADIAQHTYTLNNTQKNQQTLTTRTQSLRKEIACHTQELVQNKTQLTRVTQYLNDASALSGIDSDIADFKSHCSRLKALLQDNAALAKDNAHQQNQINQSRTNLDILQKQQEVKNTAKAAMQDELTALRKEQTALIQSQSLVDMRDEQEQIDYLNSQIEQMRAKRLQFNELSTQVAQINGVLPLLHNELAKISGTIADKESTIKDAKDKRQDKQTQLHLQQKVATLEDYIADLKDGHPCPLCGAREHPYSAKHPHLTQETESTQTQRQITALDATIADLDHALSELHINQAKKQIQFEQRQEQQILLGEQIQQLNADISQLITSALSKKDSPSTAALVQPLAQMDTNTVTLSLLDSTRDKLVTRREYLKSTLTHYEALNDALTTIRQTIEDIEKEQYTLARDIDEIEANIKFSSLTIENINKKSHDNFAVLKTLKNDILQLLSTYSASKYQSDSITAIRTLQHALQPLIASIETQTILSDGDAQAHIETLRQHHSALLQLKNQFNDKKEEEQTLKTERGRIEIQIETKQSQLDKNEDELNNLAQLVIENTEALEKSTVDREHVFTDKNPEAEETRLRTVLERATAEHITAQRQLDNTEHTLKQLQQTQQQLSEQLSDMATALDTQQRVFNAALIASDFADESEFVSARLPTAERHRLTEQQQQIIDRLKQAQSLLSKTRQSLLEKQAEPLTHKDKETLIEEQQQVQNERHRLLESIGAMSQQIKDNEEKKGSQQATLQAIAQQKETLQVWRQLNELIGSSSGKKYRTFAQGLTFDIMVKHANAQLHKMSDRYLLIRDDNSPLELNVIDNYQGGEIRSTKNLSGGEGFIISLALALGLSQMASQNIRVDSLFLDEGFGTLDEESLDIALDTLTSLQQEGKLIGVISHVQALKERILTQIRVDKLSGGFSQISGQGCRRVSS
ncbi:exonuclease SbcD [Psychrobacter sp. CCUG 69069]|uniref:AAA family ATPase n=1 Tax=Psychrobacter namhaensis TaxID=292734 RepID=A0ABW8L5N9_9GAMM|nr:AAA family ATPase [Psychrobacter sp. CCUG 69069]MCD1279645.1 exonuclease SbcD [Psychrobacter sp. CCUG 69069]